MASLNEVAAAIAPGADGLVVLDHFQANRTPFNDAASRGCLNGLSLSDTRGHIFRALMEGICGGAFSNFEQAADAMVQVERRIEPDSQRHAIYRDLIADYKALYPALRDIRC